MPIIRAAGRWPNLDVRNPAAAAPRGGSSHACALARVPGAAHSRRPAADIYGLRAPAGRSARDSGRAIDGARGGFDGGSGDDHHSARDAAFDLLIDRAVVAVREGGSRVDPVFGPYAGLNSLVRAVTYHEGGLLEDGVAVLASENASLSLMPPETALPVVPAAVEMLKRNDWASLKGIRLRSEVHHKTSYVPDLFIVDHARHCALILDVKRSLNSSPERRLNALRGRMMAAALIAADWLHIEGRVAGVSEVGVAIIDGSSERHDPASGIFALEEIGDLIGIPDAGEAMLGLRAKFALRIQNEIRAACLRAIGDDAEPTGRRADERDPDGSVGPEDPDEDDGVGLLDRSRDLLADHEEDEYHRNGRAVPLDRRHGEPDPGDRRPITVGFARSGVP